jgi:hypothetical protein
MIIIELEGKEYKMPESWIEVNLELFEKLATHANLLADYKSKFQYSVEMIAILTGAPVGDLMRMTRGSFEELSTKVEWATDEVTSTGIREWIIDGEEWMAVKDLNSLNMGDIVSVELMIQNSDSVTLLGNILPILIRRVKSIERGGKTIKVPDDFNADDYDEIKKLFKKNLSVADVMELRVFF